MASKHRRLLIKVALVLLVPGLVWLIGMRLYNLRPLGALPKPTGRIQQESAQDWGRIVVDKNHCVLVNNVWNRSSAGKEFEQAVFLEQDESKNSIGWRWRSPWQWASNVVSQPQIVCGDKPWDEPMRLISAFPFQAGSRRLTADFNIRLRASGTYNMAFTVWAVSALPASKATVSHEIMIWNARAGQNPAGSPRGSLDVNGTTYDVYVEENHGDASGANKNAWTYVAFVARKPVWHGPLDISAFIDYLLDHKLLSRSHYLTSLELGNEVCQGTGIAEIQDFSLRFQ